MVELSKALTLEEHASDHLVILLDEPTSVLERAEIDVLFARVRSLNSRASFFFVSHRLDEFLDLSNRLYVMTYVAVCADLVDWSAGEHSPHHPMVGRRVELDLHP